MVITWREMRNNYRASSGDESSGIRPGSGAALFSDAWPPCANVVLRRRQLQQHMVPFKRLPAGGAGAAHTLACER